MGRPQHSDHEKHFAYASQSTAGAVLMDWSFLSKRNRKWRRTALELRTVTLPPSKSSKELPASSAQPQLTNWCPGQF